MDATHTTADRVVLVLAALVHVGVGVFPLSATGLLAPLWYVALTGVAWIVGAVLLWRMARSAPRWTWVVPVGLVALWVGGLTLGDVLLGWTA